MRILVALSRFPWPIEKGDKLRAYYQLKGLAENHTVHLVCLSDQEVTPAMLEKLSFCASVTVIRLPKWRSALNLFAGIFDRIPFQVHFFRSNKMKAVIAEQLKLRQIDVVYVQLIRLGMNLPSVDSKGWFMDYMDTFSIGMKQREQQSAVWLRPLVRKETRRLLRYEDEIGRRFAGLSVISERDAEGLPAHLTGKLSIIANGVGEQFFERQASPSEMEHDLVFFGNMGYHPNVQSARYLMEEVLPALRRKGIEPRVCLAGARPVPLIQAYAGEKVTVTGFIDDIRVPILKSKLAIAPVIAGQGMQNKLLESMAMGIPTLTTPLAHAAVPAEAGKELIVCNTAEEFADEIKRLLENPALAAEIGQAGRRFVEQYYRWSEMNKRLEAALIRCKG